MVHRRTAAGADRKTAHEHWPIRIRPPVSPRHFHTCVENFAPTHVPRQSATTRFCGGRTAPGADWRTPYEHGTIRLSPSLSHRHFHIVVEIFAARHPALPHNSTRLG